MSKNIAGKMAKYFHFFSFFLLGLGVSLFSSRKTLLEQMDQKALDAALKDKSSFYKSLFL